ncbi:MAG: hypothetical protein ACOYOB_05045 [Myxococcota bacterium]
MTDPTWLRPAAAAAMLLALSSPARAWDGVTPAPVAVNASGLAVGPLLGTADFGGRAMWVDAAGRVIALDATPKGPAQVLTSLPPRCWQLNVKDSDLGPIVGPDLAPQDSVEWRLAARMGRDTVLALAFHRTAGDPYPYKLGSVDVFESSCSTKAKQITTFTVPKGIAMANRIPAEALPLTAKGVVYLVLDDLVRIDTQAAAPSWEVVATQADLRALVGVPATQKVAFRAIALTADERLWATYELLQPDSEVATAGGLVELGKDGKLKVLHGPDPNLTGFAQMLRSPQLDKMLIALPKVFVPPVARYRALAVLDEAAPFAFSGHAPPWPVAGPLDDDTGLIGSFDGSVYARTPLVVTTIPEKWIINSSLQPVAFVPAVADFDRDGVSAKREVELGLSDQQYDFDGDGYNDGAELGLLGTDPKDPASHPSAPPALADVMYGPSFLIGDARQFTPYYNDVGFQSVPDQDTSLQCGHVTGTNCPSPAKLATVGSLACVDSKATPVCLAWPTTFSYGAVTPDRHYAFYFVLAPHSGGGAPDKVGIDRFDFTTGQIDHPFPLATDLSAFDGAIYPVSATEVLLSKQFREVVRVSAAGLKPILWSGGDSGCPMTADQTSLVPCTGDQGPGQAGSMRTVGYHAGTQSWVFSFPRGILSSYIAVSKDKVGFVGNEYEIADGLELEVLRDIPGGGLLAKASRFAEGAGWNGTYLLPDLFGPGLWSGRPQPHVFGNPGPWFFRGFFGDQNETYKKVKMPAGCMPKIPCKFSFEPPVIDSLESFRAEWVPVGAALEKGEVIFATEQRYRAHMTGSPLYWKEADGSYQGFGSKWLLGRFTRLGAVVEWLDAASFAKLVTDPVAAAALASIPLGEVTAIGASADNSRLCVAESGRVWELALTDGRLKGITLADPGPGRVGCAYDQTGKLARLEASPAAVHVGDQTLAGDPESVGAGLVRVGNQWLIRSMTPATGAAAGAAEAYCLSDTGQVTPTGKQMVAIAEVPTGVAYIDPARHGWTGRDPCAATSTFPEEHLDGVDVGGLWETSYTGLFTTDTVPAKTGALAMRPDRMFLMSPGKFASFTPQLLFRLMPTYAPLDPAQRIAENDPYRRAEMRRLPASTWAVYVTAMVTIPGGDPKADWGQFDPDPPAVWTPPATKPPEKGDPSATAAAEKDAGCSSTTGGGSAAVLLLLVGLQVGLWRTRRRAGRQDLSAAP